MSPWSDHLFKMKLFPSHANPFSPCFHHCITSLNDLPPSTVYHKEFTAFRRCVSETLTHYDYHSIFHFILCRYLYLVICVFLACVIPCTSIVCVILPYYFNSCFPDYVIFAPSCKGLGRVPLWKTNHTSCMKRSIRRSNYVL